MKREHEKVNQNIYLAPFLSVQVKLSHGFITATKIENVSFQIPYLLA